jgi:hypothetical protein
VISLPATPRSEHWSFRLGFHFGTRSVCCLSPRRFLPRIFIFCRSNHSRSCHRSRTRFSSHFLSPAGLNLGGGHVSVLRFLLAAWILHLGSHPCGSCTDFLLCRCFCYRSRPIFLRGWILAVAVVLRSSPPVVSLFYCQVIKF